ncbi:MAG: hypothetical protein GY861_11860, partial [bacterium]|nr:hypothetical protein [bacterium]
MKILYDNIIKTATITSSSEASDYEWDTALNDIRLSRVGRTTGDSSEWLKFAFDTVQAVDYVAILGHNLSEDAVITLQGNNIDSWVSPSFSEQVSLADTGNFYSTKRVSSQVFQDVSNSFSGTSPIDYIQNADELVLVSHARHSVGGSFGTQYSQDVTDSGTTPDGYISNGTKNYNWFTDNSTNFQNGSLVDVIVDLDDWPYVTWFASGDVQIQFADSTDNITYGSWTSAIDATTTEIRNKVSRYMKCRVIFDSSAWDDTTSYLYFIRGKDYRWFTDNPTNFQHGSIYESIALDLRSENGIKWTALGDAYVQFRDSTDGSSWGSWTTAIDATLSVSREKVYRYMQIRVLMTHATWEDTTSYFELLTPAPEEQPIIVKNVTESAYKYWKIKFVDPLNTDGYIEIGNIFLGDSLTMPGMDVNKIVAKKTNSTYTKNLGGQLFSNPRVQLKYAEITFTDIIDEYKNNVERFSDTVDITIPFVL